MKSKKAISVARQLRARLMLTALLAVVPSLCAIVYLQVVERREAEQRIGPENERLVRLAAGEYTGTIFGARRLLRTLASVPLLAGRDSASCRTLVTAVLREHPGYVNLAAANMDGSVFCSAKPMEKQLLHPATEQSWFQRAVASRGSSLGDVQVSATNGRPAILLGQPVFDRQKRIVHVLVATIDLTALGDAVSPAALPPRSTLTLFNQAGILLARTPRGGRIGAPVANPHLLDRARHSPTISTDEHVASDGVRRIYTTLAVSELPGLFVTLGVDRAAAYAEVNRILRRDILLLLLGSMAAMIAGAFGGQAFVVSPVVKLKGVMTRLAGGDLSARADLGGAAYGLAELGDAVNAMAESLHKRDLARADAEERQRAAEERLHFALDAANVGIWEADLATGRSYWSPECERMHGLEPASFGCTFDAFIACVHPQDQAAVQKHLAEAATTPTLTTFTYRTLWPNSAVRVLTSSARFVFENDRAVRGAGIVLDVTDRWELEEQLQQAQKMEAVGQLAGGVAHDFNNLLTIILGNAEILEATHAPEPHAWPELEEVRSAAKRAAELTRQLLAFSRKQTLALKPADVGAIVDDLVPMLRRLIGEDIEIRSNCEPDALFAMVDRAHFEQALINVAVNARDAMPMGGALTIDVGVRELASQEIKRAGMELMPGRHVMVSVTDTGRGMSADVLAHAFEPFFTTKEVGQGTGLGLSSVYGTVKQCGGHVMATSALGKGTTITIYLPQLEMDAAEESRQPRGALASAFARTILLVEDEDAVRALTARVLSSAGYRVLAARNGNDAVRKARAHIGSISMVLTDVVMPGMPVGEMISELRHERSGIPVLMMSGYPDTDIVRRGVVPGSVSLFHKPFETSELLARVAASIREGEREAVRG